jgi:PTH1 family peptidyl-tRNA hydrolase
MEEIYLIAGLGNPGNKYNATRHNAGFEVAELLGEKNSIQMNKSKFKALYGEGRIAGKKVLLVKPQTYMNLSGECIREISEWFKINESNIIIIYDDIDLAVGKIRVRSKGSAGTHNGMRSIIYQTQTDNFPRVRVGVGKPPPEWNLADYVLSRFTAEEKDTVISSMKLAADAVEAIIAKGIDTAMNLYNK